jgi:thymidylate synthase (FAD)
MHNIQDLSEEPRVELFSFAQINREILEGLGEKEVSPDEIAGYVASADFEEKTSIGLLLEDLKTLPKEEIRKKVERIVRNSYGRGHGSVGDQIHLNFSIEGLTRAATLQLTGPLYLEHEQQSFRRAKPTGIFIPKSIVNSQIFGKVRKILFDASSLYEEMCEEVPKEDARYCLSLLTKTNITTCGNIRELQHLQEMCSSDESPSYVRKVVEEIIKKGSEVAPILFQRYDMNCEPLNWYPSTDLFSSTNQEIEELVKAQAQPEKTVFIQFRPFPLVTERTVEKAVRERDEASRKILTYTSFLFLVPVSIAANHQLRRNRTLNIVDESLFDAAERSEFITPPKIENSKFSKRYEEQCRAMIELYREIIEEGVSRQEAIGVIPHSTIMYDLIDVDGFNLYHFIGQKRCSKAQWEIRGRANEMAEFIKKESPLLGMYAEPNGVIFGRCPEREPCGYCAKVLKPGVCSNVF